MAKRQGKKLVMIFGTFTILHPGHLYFFRESKKCGDNLIVVVARDSTVKKVKGFLPRLDEKARLEMVGSVKLVDKAVLGDKKDWYKLILKYRPDVICLGYDQMAPRNFKDELAKRRINATVARLKSYRPEKYKSSKILNK